MEKGREGECQGSALLPPGREAGLVPISSLIGSCGSLFCPHDSLQHIYGQREDDGRVFLGSDGGQRLKVPQLEGSRGLSDDHGGLFQSPGRVHLSLSRNDLWSSGKERLNQSKRWVSSCSLQTQAQLAQAAHEVSQGAGHSCPKENSFHSVSIWSFPCNWFARVCAGGQDVLFRGGGCTGGSGMQTEVYTVLWI